MTTYGWDMSHYDAPSIGNAISQGISFITHKAGGDASDQELGQWWSVVRTLPFGVVLGAYWVLSPGLAAGKADAFLARLDDQCPGWRQRDAFILQLDAEEWNGAPSTRPSIAECNAFCDRLVARTSGRYLPIGYLPEWVYGDVSSFRYPVWASSYVTGSGGFKTLYPGDSSSRWASYGRTVTILQYTSSATIGGQTTCDANAFRGTVAQLKQIVTPGGDMAVEQSDIQAIAKATADAVWAAQLVDPSDTTGKTTKSAGAYLRYRDAVDVGQANRVLAAMAQQFAAVPTADATADAVLAALGDEATNVDEIVAALKAALGDRAAEVGAGLQS